MSVMGVTWSWHSLCWLDSFLSFNSLLLSQHWMGTRCPLPSLDYRNQCHLLQAERPLATGLVPNYHPMPPLQYLAPSAPPPVTAPESLCCEALCLL